MKITQRSRSLYFKEKYNQKQRECLRISHGSHEKYFCQKKQHRKRQNKFDSEETTAINSINHSLTCRENKFAMSFDKNNDENCLTTRQGFYFSQNQYHSKIQNRIIYQFDKTGWQIQKRKLNSQEMNKIVDLPDALITNQAYFQNKNNPSFFQRNIPVRKNIFQTITLRQVINIRPDYKKEEKVLKDQENKLNEIILGSQLTFSEQKSIVKNENPSLQMMNFVLKQPQKSKQDLCNRLRKNNYKAKLQSIESRIDRLIEITTKNE